MALQIPENNDKTKPVTFVPGKKSIPKPVAKPSFVPNDKKGIPEDNYRKNALKKRLSPHEQHVRHLNHVNHMNNLKNKGK